VPNVIGLDQTSAEAMLEDKSACAILQNFRSATSATAVRRTKTPAAGSRFNPTRSLARHLIAHWRGAIDDSPVKDHFPQRNAGGRIEGVTVMQPGASITFVFIESSQGQAAFRWRKLRLSP